MLFEANPHRLRRAWQYPYHHVNRWPAIHNPLDKV